MPSNKHKPRLSACAAFIGGFSPAIKEICRVVVCLAVVVCPALLGINTVAAVDIGINRPGDREFVLDLANVITDSDEQRIRDRCNQLLNDSAIPIVVVTIDSMANYGGSGLRIETFALLLFNQWGIGHEQLHGQPWNTGILLLVSIQDRKARIELGAGWGREKDAVCDRIMNQQIIPRFKQGDYSGGISAGVVSLDRMARDLALPSVPLPWWVYPAVLCVIGLAIFTFVSLLRTGASGWAWAFWGAVFALIGALLYHLATSRSNDSGGGFSGGSFGGGSFGGGFSGGGGSTGSW